MPVEDQYLILGCKSGQCVRLERAGALPAQRAVRRLRGLGWAVSVLVALEPSPSPPTATRS